MQMKLAYEDFCLDLIQNKLIVTVCNEETATQKWRWISWKKPALPPSLEEILAKTRGNQR